MLNSGQALLDKNYRSYPASLPLLVFHGNEDQVTWHDASQQFVEKVKANDKQFISLPGYYHEAHNEVRDCIFVKTVADADSNPAWRDEGARHQRCDWLDLEACLIRRCGEYVLHCYHAWLCLSFSMSASDSPSKRVNRYST